MTICDISRATVIGTLSMNIIIGTKKTPPPIPLMVVTMAIENPRAIKIRIEASNSTMQETSNGHFRVRVRFQVRVKGIGVPIARFSKRLFYNSSTREHAKPSMWAPRRCSAYLYSCKHQDTYGAHDCGDDAL